MPTNRDPLSERGVEGRPKNPQRRTFLRYVGVGVSGLAMGWLPASCARPPRSGGSAATRTADLLGLAFESPAYPLPLPGEPNEPPDVQRFATYEVFDDLVLPAGHEWRVVAQWGDRLGTEEHSILVGNNADYTGLLPMDEGGRDFWLFVNHEYVSPRPWLDDYAQVYGKDAPDIRLLADDAQPRGIIEINGWRSSDHRLDFDRDQAPAEVLDAARDLARTFLSEMGVSVLHVRRRADDHFEVVADSTRHRRVSTSDTQNVDPINAPRLTGPATSLLGTEGLGTMCNCSGGTTPWGTFLTCEENIQNQVVEAVDPSGESLSEPRRLGFVAGRVGGERSFDHPTPAIIDGNGMVALEHPLDGRKYGWVGEVDPNNGLLQKHTALGRFRHENIALRAEAGKPLVAYMGDDRRGGHVWRFVSTESIERPENARNSELFQDGVLSAARFDSDWQGRWLPIRANTPLARPIPERCVDGFLYLPNRDRSEAEIGGFVRVGTDEIAADDEDTKSVEEWCTTIEQWAGRPFDQCTLGDLVAPELRSDPAKVQAVLVLDAFAMANAAGATPTARPEDVEVHPVDSSVFIAFTDATGGSDGSPDGEVFPDAREESSRQYGALYRVVDEIDGSTFQWGRFLASGEVVEDGGGFACADNLAFDPAANLWMVTDISASALNFPVREGAEESSIGSSPYRGVFGNNALFRIATEGPDSGVPRVFGIGPVDCELTGPTFSDDGRTLILSVQHPGEQTGTRRSVAPTRSVEVDIRGRGGETIRQRRTVPTGSNFPSAALDTPPRSCVVSIVDTRSGESAQTEDADTTA